MPKKNGVGVRIQLDDGYVVMERMTIRQYRALRNAGKDIDPALDAIESACIEAKFKNGKPLEDQPLDVLTAIAKGWDAKEDEVALPPENAPPSVLPSTGK